MIKVLLADDQALVRAGFHALLDAQDDIEVVGEAADGAEAVRLAGRYHPDVLLMDIRMPGLDGLGVVSEIRKIDPAARIVAVTGQIDHPAVRDLQRLNISRFLAKPYSADTLLRSIRDALES